MGQQSEQLRLTGIRLDLRTKLIAAGVAATLVVLIAVGLYAWQTGTQLEDLSALGYPGVFLVMVLSGGSMFFPAPGQATILAGGALWNPIVVGLVAGLGNATGELTGYVAGRAGETVLQGRKRPRLWLALRRWLCRYGFFAIVFLAMIPNPVFDVIGVLAGSACYPVRRFWMACVIGNTVKYTALAHLGDATRLWLG